MATLPKIKAKVIAKKESIYEFEELSSHKRFSGSVDVFHKIVDYPPPLIGHDGKLLVGSIIDIVAKTLGSGTIAYYPDISVYRTQEDINDSVSPEELAANLLNFIDHIDEITKEQEREIVKALSNHYDKTACSLIRNALLLNN